MLIGGRTICAILVQVRALIKALDTHKPRSPSPPMPSCLGYLLTTEPLRRQGVRALSGHCSGGASYPYDQPKSACLSQNREWVPQPPELLPPYRARGRMQWGATRVGSTMLRRKRRHAQSCPVVRTAVTWARTAAATATTAETPSLLPQTAGYEAVGTSGVARAGVVRGHRPPPCLWS